MPVYNNSNSTRWNRKDTRKEFNEKNRPVTITDDDNKNRETIYDEDSREEERKPLKADTMDMNEVNVYSVGPNDNTSSTKYNRPRELSGAYQRMSERGIHFTSYTETYPASGETYSWSERSGSSFSSSGFNKGKRVPGPIRYEEGDNDETTE